MNFLCQGFRKLSDKQTYTTENIPPLPRRFACGQILLKLYNSTQQRNEAYKCNVHQTNDV